MRPPLLSIEALRVSAMANGERIRVVDDLDLTIATGETVGLVGESGCGKSITALSVLDLLPKPPFQIDSGRIRFDGLNLHRLSGEPLRRIRGGDIAMIFQEPMTALNPVLTIGRQLCEPLVTHLGLRYRTARRRAAVWLRRVNIAMPEKLLKAYPHELSGGMRQRVMIAMAMACRPRLLIADEPTTALDVTIQAQILALMNRLKAHLGSALLLITHDLGVVAQMASRVVVMYAGQVVESAAVSPLFAAPFHPYTEALLAAVPRWEEAAGEGALRAIQGTVPAPGQALAGCRFAARCRHAFERCRAQMPPLFEIADGHVARCWLQPYPERRAGGAP
ncbi:MAG: ABC transporter ATP-binding protein [Desulfosarcinaceae bacterium]|nr:ABC transporter ATP-binding protein [Desulfosarcinaceae bacterium]